MPRTKNSLTVVRGISLPRTLDDLLVLRAKRDDKSVSRIVQRALEQYLKTKG